MPEATRTTRIRLELTEDQKEQIRQATGQAVSKIELRLHRLPASAELAGPVEERAAG